MLQLLRTATATLACISAFGQSADTPKFDVASVRVAAPRGRGESTPLGARTGGPGTSSPERISWRATILGNLIREAYGVKRLQVLGPQWIMTFDDVDTRFDISATMPPGTSKERLNLMLRSLLEERFGVKVHWETQERPAYTLVVAKGGAKLKESNPTDKAICFLMASPKNDRIWAEAGKGQGAGRGAGDRPRRKGTHGELSMSRQGAT